MYHVLVALYNAVPFVGFGFLDNTIMILGVKHFILFLISCKRRSSKIRNSVILPIFQGDSIELMVGSVITISTMMAAALGNTLSDIVSIGSAFYVEKFAAKLGVKKPQLTTAQLNLSSVRFTANMVRFSSQSE